MTPIEQKYNDLRNQMRDILIKANDENREITEEEVAKFIELEDQMIEILENL